MQVRAPLAWEPLKEPLCHFAWVQRFALARRVSSDLHLHLHLPVPLPAVVARAVFAFHVHLAHSALARHRWTRSQYPSSSLLRFPPTARLSHQLLRAV